MLVAAAAAARCKFYSDRIQIENGVRKTVSRGGTLPFAEDAHRVIPVRCAGPKSGDEDNIKDAASIANYFLRDFFKCYRTGSMGSLMQQCTKALHERKTQTMVIDFNSQSSPKRSVTPGWRKVGRCCETFTACETKSPQHY